MDQLAPPLAASRPLLLALACLAALSGCSDHADSKERELEAGTLLVTAEAGAEAGLLGTADGNVATESFRVSIETDRAAKICPGACVALTARADYGVPPYRLVFDHGLGEGSGPHQVCPTQTTTYQVSASDSSVEGELGGNGEVSQSISIEVDPSCVSGADAGTGAETTAVTTPGSPICTQAIATVATAENADNYFDIWNDDFSGKVDTDATGNVVFAATYRGSIKLINGATLSSGDGTAILVGKLSVDCKPIWFKSLQGSQAAYEPIVSVDSEGRIVVLGSTATSTPVGWFSQGAFYLTQLAADGAVLWEKRIESAPGLQWQRSLRTDANDDIVLMVAAAAGSNFGGGALGANSAAAQDPTIVVLAKYHANGDHVWSKLLQEAPTRVSMAIQNGTDIVFHGWADQARNWGAGGRTNGSLAGQGHGYLVRANGAGNFVWSKRVSDGNLEQYSWHWLEVTLSNQLVLSNFAVSGQLVLSSPNADAVWAKMVINPALGLSDDWHKTSVDAQGNPLVGGGFSGSTSVNGVALTGPANNGKSTFVQKLDATGAVRWTYQSNGLTPQQGASHELLGLAADTQSNVFGLLSYMDFDSRALYLVKLAR